MQTFDIVSGFIYLKPRAVTNPPTHSAPTLGLLHLRLKAWSGLASSLSANWLYSRSHSTLPSPESPGLKSILLYLGLCTLLQVSSGSIFGESIYNRLVLAGLTWGSASTFDLNTSESLVDYWTPYVISGARFGDFDSLWPSSINISSSDTFLFSPAARVSRYRDNQLLQRSSERRMQP
jgi:hypothetical protein